MRLGQGLGRPFAAQILVRVAELAAVGGTAIEGKAGVGVHQHMLVDVAEALDQVVTGVLGAPDQTTQPPPRKHLIHQQLQPRPVFVVDADQDHAVAGQ